MLVDVEWNSRKPESARINPGRSDVCVMTKRSLSSST